jgi:hypothetical protein
LPLSCRTPDERRYAEDHRLRYRRNPEALEFSRHHVGIGRQTLDLRVVEKEKEGTHTVALLVDAGDPGVIDSHLYEHLQTSVGLLPKRAVVGWSVSWARNSNGARTAQTTLPASSAAGSDYSGLSGSSSGG